MSRLNKLKPDPEAESNHTTFIENIWGEILKYATYFRNRLNPSGFDEVKRVDMVGKGHRNKHTGEQINTPHVHEKGAKGDVRKARKDEVPKREKRKNDDDKS